MATVKTTFAKNFAKDFSELVAQDIAQRFFYELKLLQFISEINLIKSKKIKGMSYENFKKYFNKRLSNLK